MAKQPLQPVLTGISWSYYIPLNNALNLYESSIKMI